MRQRIIAPMAQNIPGRPESVGLFYLATDEVAYERTYNHTD